MVCVRAVYALGVCCVGVRGGCCVCWWGGAMTHLSLEPLFDDMFFV
jgi:hypothetical protein